VLSVILYGRNDSHGYNYHKRLAISLNCIAEVLSFESDEIIFVDYNSPEDVPTVLEAVADTLSEKAKSLVKIFRIRPRICSHKNSALPGEPLSRNAAIRRSNPNNKWILSTNIDMVFVPVDANQTLSTLVADLPDGFYQLPRFELPENLWESHFNRLKPDENISFLREHAPEMQLNTIVRRPGFLTYDNPGDFQLMPRKAIFEIHGFNEQMQQGWHLDSNLCKRMSLYYKGEMNCLEGKLWGYHCNHTRQASFFHAQLTPENNWNTFVKDVFTPDLPKQKESWGLKEKELEEVSINEPKCLSSIKSHASFSEFSIDQESFNTLTYNSARIFIHLSDHFHHLPTSSKIAYIGHNKELLKLIQTSFPAVMTLSSENSLKELYEQTDLMIFDFGFDEKSFKGLVVTPTHKLYEKLRGQLKEIMQAFLEVVHLEKRQKKKKKLLGVNVLFTDFRGLFHHHLSMQKTTFLTGISFGYVKQKQKTRSKNSWCILKKRLKFYLMYLTVCYFYNFTDKVRRFSYQSRFLKKVFQLK